MAQSQSQLAPLPQDLPFRIISKTIGRGAYASIKKAIPPNDTSPVFAVKFIHKAYAIRHGRLSAKQIAMEVSLHSHIGKHPNIIEWFATGEDATWKWIAMEYAEGGDLFDKIEADVGVSEDIAHFYFTQLINGVSYMHSKGVGHRDIKPENILLSDSGNLKIADFGLATLFEYNGKTKLSTTMCGSPPYIAPEVISCSRDLHSRASTKSVGYAANLVDVWSCGVVLFVLLIGNTPWDEPTSHSWEFEEYLGKKGRTSDDLWQKLPSSVLSLLRGMMNVDVTKRFNFNYIKNHPWYTRSNPLLTADGRMSNPLSLATQMLEELHIDFTQIPTGSRHSGMRGRDSISEHRHEDATRFSFTQPELPVTDIDFDWERPSLRNANLYSASQPADALNTNTSTFEYLCEEPGMSQFSPMPTIPTSLTQHARLFKDIIPAQALTRFLSHLQRPLLLQTLASALHSLNVPISPISDTSPDRALWIKIKTLDGRRCSLHGDIVVEIYHGTESQLTEVRFVKIKGDPLEWRRFFKHVVVLCKDAVFIPGY
ncbi:BgTH12-01825 [Blumeria graminis f. sp. triticale]|uniref:non-specific serine/threonine protein kinase n=3 Tax=Blumeria graminis TaxID=34373 RepID=A0A381LL29_BLUGR|nr:Serine-threonine kinase [Blumeria graminis f. sp. tritici 96224]CAD6501574.1 BgTH12-01825 [Blumeria graminis f. sp. triticale]VDB84123.1 Bgt-4462 [Blumeria graminis f. sp. tritici]